MNESFLQIDPKLCMNWLPRYRHCLLVYQTLQSLIYGRLTDGKSSYSRIAQENGVDLEQLEPTHVRPVLIDAVFDDNDWQGYIVDQFRDCLYLFDHRQAYLPISDELGFLVAKGGPRSDDLLQNVIPYMTPGPTTIAAIFSLQANAKIASSDELIAAHGRRKAAARNLRQRIQQEYDLFGDQAVVLHAAGVGGLIEGTTRYLHLSKPQFSSAVLVPEYWDLLRFLLTYSPKGIRVAIGRDQPSFPAAAWLEILCEPELDFAYLSFTNNPLGTTIPLDALRSGLDAISDTTLFFLDCTSIDVEHRSSVSALSELIREYAHKNLIVAKSFSKDYDRGDLRLGYAIFTRKQTCDDIWPFLRMYPPEYVSNLACQLFDTGFDDIYHRYSLANQDLQKLETALPDIRISGHCSNYTSLEFANSDCCETALEKIKERFGAEMYPGELPMRGGGQSGLGDSEIDLTSMRSIPFLSENFLRLLVSREAISALIESLSIKKTSPIE